MSTFNIRSLLDGDSIVFHFETPLPQINAYTLASLLVSIADAAKAANRSVNPGFDVEIVVEAIGPGSFRVKISAIYRSLKDIFSTKGAATNIIVGVIAASIYQRSCSPEPTITVTTDEVVITTAEGHKVIVPRHVYDATTDAERAPAFRNAVNRTFEAIARDKDISALGFVRDVDSPPPELPIPRERIVAAVMPTEDDQEERYITEIADLSIVKAVLEQGRRKWEFVWRGFKISAPVNDKAFHDRFRAHEITIAPGDQLRVQLKIKQRRDQETRIYSNVAYEVTDVLAHIPGFRQMGLHQGTDGADR